MNLEILKPSSKKLVYDLVTQAGIDTGDWARFKGPHPSTNPKYCYEWAFWDEAKRVVALCLWYSQMKNDGGRIAQTLNYRALASASSHRDPSVGVRAKRATRMDRALFMAFKRKLPVRVIVVDGARRGESGADFSKVELRMLDPVPWAVVSYDPDSGECQIVRGEQASDVRTFLLTWSNFEETPDEDLLAVGDELKKHPSHKTEWSSGNRRDINVGERVFLLRQGDDYPGIVGRGTVATAPYPGRHWDPEKRKAGIKASYVEVNWHEMRPKEAGLPRETLIDAGFPVTVLNAQSSGVIVPEDAVPLLDKLWADRSASGSGSPSATGRIDETVSRRLARIAYNSAGWQRPTGDAGELESDETYNARNKFGHEDWLFRSEWVIDGWRYAFIQGLNKNREHYLGQSFDVTLYTLLPDKRRRLVATIHDLEALSDEQAEDALAVFRQKGWLKTMQDEVRAIGGNADALGAPNWAQHVLNVRFRADEAEHYPANTFLPEDEWIKARHRYMLYKMDATDIERIERSLPGRGGSQEAPNFRRYFRRGTKPIECTPEHVKMQAKLMAELKAEHGENCVWREANFVDLLVETEDELTFFEIKTDLDPCTVIRQAVGQLLEYAYHPSRTGRRPDKLVIVGRNPLKPDDQSYLDALRTQFELPVSYRVVSI